MDFLKNLLGMDQQAEPERPVWQTDPGVAKQFAQSIGAVQPQPRVSVQPTQQSTGQGSPNYQIANPQQQVGQLRQAGMGTVNPQNQNPAQNIRMQQGSIPSTGGKFYEDSGSDSQNLFQGGDSLRKILSMLQR